MGNRCKQNNGEINARIRRSHPDIIGKKRPGGDPFSLLSHIGPLNRRKPSQKKKKVNEKKQIPNKPANPSFKRFVSKPEESSESSSLPSSSSSSSASPSPSSNESDSETSVTSSSILSIFKKKSEQKKKTLKLSDFPSFLLETRDEKIRELQRENYFLLQKVNELKGCLASKKTKKDSFFLFERTQESPEQIQQDFPIKKRNKCFQKESYSPMQLEEGDSSSSYFGPEETSKGFIIEGKPKGSGTGIMSQEKPKGKEETEKKSNKGGKPKKNHKEEKTKEDDQNSDEASKEEKRRRETESKRKRESKEAKPEDCMSLNPNEKQKWPKKTKGTLKNPDKKESKEATRKAEANGGISLLLHFDPFVISESN